LKRERGRGSFKELGTEKTCVLQKVGGPRKAKPVRQGLISRQTKEDFLSEPKKVGGGIKRKGT